MDTKLVAMHLILYSKPGCHLCEGLQEKLEQIQTIPIELEIRDITTREDWFRAYEYEIPVLMLVKESGDERQPNEQTPMAVPQSLKLLPRLSPRATVQQLETMLKKYVTDEA